MGHCVISPLNVNNLICLFFDCTCSCLAELLRRTTLFMVEYRYRYVFGESRRNMR